MLKIFGQNECGNRQKKQTAFKESLECIERPSLDHLGIAPQGEARQKSGYALPIGLVSFAMNPAEDFLFPRRDSIQPIAYGNRRDQRRREAPALPSRAVGAEDRKRIE